MAFEMLAMIGSLVVIAVSLFGLGYNVGKSGAYRECAEMRRRRGEKW